MDTKLLKTNTNDLHIAANIIRSGGTVVFPTETVYGLGADATNPSAVEKIFKAKGRPSDNPLIVHIYDIKQLNEIVKEVSSDAQKLMNAFWPGPLTIILNKSDKISDAVTAGMDTVGVRMPGNEVANDLLRLTDRPVAAPSANLSGKPSPTKFEHCMDDMFGRVDAIIDGGSCNVGVESTVIDMSAKPVIFRPGDITKSEIEHILGKKVGYITSTKDNEKPKSPGLKYKHYSPNSELVILSGNLNEITDYVNQISGNKGILVFDELIPQLKSELNSNIKIISLGSMKSPKEVAKNLFKSLRDIDDLDIDIAFAPEIPESDKWSAVRNRLYRAAGNNIIKTNKSELGNISEVNMSLNEPTNKHIMFVCTGNTCRSPVAEYLFNQAAEKNNLGYFATSAGISAFDGRPASLNSKIIMEENNIDISKFKSSQLTLEMVEEADLILTMSELHKSSILNSVPNAKSRVFTLTEYVNELGDIPDPYSGNLNEYRNCFKQINSIVNKIVKKLINVEQNYD